MWIKMYAVCCDNCFHCSRTKRKSDNLKELLFLSSLGYCPIGEMMETQCSVCRGSG